MRIIAALTIFMAQLLLVDAYGYRGLKTSPFGRKVSAAAAFRIPGAPILDDPGPDFNLLAGGPGTMDTEAIRHRINHIQEIVEKNARKAFFRPEAMAALIAEDAAAEAVMAAEAVQDVSAGRASGVDSEVDDLDDLEEEEKEKEKKKKKKGGKVVKTGFVEVIEFRPGTARRPSVLYAELIKPSWVDGKKKEKKEKDDDDDDDDKGKKKKKKHHKQDDDDDDDDHKDKKHKNRTKLRIAASRQRLQQAHARFMNMMQMARSVVGRMFGRPQWMLPGFPTGFMFPMMGPMMGPRPFNAVKTVSEGPLTKFWKSLVKKVQKRIARWKIRMGSFGLRKPSKTNLEPQKSSKTLPAPENNGDITDIENKIDEPQTIADSNEKLSSKKPAQKPAKKAVSLAAVVGEEVAPVQGMRLRGDEIVEVDRILAPSHSGGPFPRRVKGVRKGMV